jgi:hypothetical protein
MVEEAAHLAFLPSGIPYHNTIKSAPTASRQHDPTAADAPANIDNGDSTS